MPTARYKSHTRRTKSGKTVRVKGHKRNRTLQLRRAGRNVKKAFRPTTGAGKGLLLLVAALGEVLAFLLLRTTGLAFYLISALFAVMAAGAFTATGKKVKKKR